MTAYDIRPETVQDESTDVIARFTIQGNPRPKQRPRFGKGRTFTPKETVLAESTVLDAFFDAYPFWETVTGKVRLECVFYRDSKRIVDLDNLVKLVQDALNKHLFKDDSQIVSAGQELFYTRKERARTEVVLTLVHGDRVEVLS